MPFCLRVAPALLVCMLAANAGAEVVSNTKVTYFVVEGATPVEIYRNILDRGPRVGGARALASIGTRTTQDGALRDEGGVCRVRDYVITLDFEIQRPRIGNEQVLPESDRAMWQQVSGFIAAHETQHRNVWQSCAADLDRRVATLEAPTCSDLGAKAEALWQEMLTSCDALQRSFDDEQARALMRQPFMRHALEAAE